MATEQTERTESGERAGRRRGNDTYRVDEWGGGFYRIDDRGVLRVQPMGPEGPSVRLPDVVAALREHGLNDPMLIRFPQILVERQSKIRRAFESAIAEYGYPAGYRGVFPVKVNHDRTVVETLIKAGREKCFGIEVGSKAELVLALTLDLHPDSLVICNGFKDRDYLELAVHATRHGRKVVVIAENPQEVEDVIRTTQEIGQRILVGLRARLHAAGFGRWQESSGAKGKFGLSTIEIVEAIETLERAGLIDDVVALHFHIGSQVSDILNLKEAMKEASRLYCAMKQQAPALRYLDIGGGLGIDYDGSRTATDWSMNYTVEEYARDAVYLLSSICSEVGIEPPTIITESGRALTAHHAMIVLSSLRVVGGHEARDYSRFESDSPQVEDLKETLERMDADNWRESIHDAEQLLSELLMGFKMGIVSIEDRAVGECLYNDVCAAVAPFMKNDRRGVEIAKKLEKQQAPKYVCNFSVFMSTPDAWAVEQLFPVCPLEDLNSTDVHPATIGDITCDSDGKLERFIGRGENEPFILLHEPKKDAQYQIGLFHVGAYQDVLGDFHNLFGTVDEGVVIVNDEDEFSIVQMDEGSSVEYSLAYFGFSPTDMVRNFDRLIDRRQNRESVRDYKGAFLRVLHGNTYVQRA